jgi:hypothetical protein
MHSNRYASLQFRHVTTLAFPGRYQKRASEYEKTSATPHVPGVTLLPRWEAARGVLSPIYRADFKPPSCIEVVDVRGPSQNKMISSIIK